MTEPVVCKKGRCEYKDDRLNQEWKDDCKGCDEIEEIEHGLLSGKLRRSAKRK